MITSLLRTSRLLQHRRVSQMVVNKNEKEGGGKTAAVCFLSLICGQKGGRYVSKEHTHRRAEREKERKRERNLKSLPTDEKE